MSSAASLNLGQSQNGVLRNGLTESQFAISTMFMKAFFWSKNSGLCFNSLPNNKINVTLVQIRGIFKENVTGKFNLFCHGSKTFWEKNEMLITSIFSLGQIFFFKDLFFRVVEKLGLCGIGLKG